MKGAGRQRIETRVREHIIHQEYTKGGREKMCKMRYSIRN